MTARVTSKLVKLLSDAGVQLDQEQVAALDVSLSAFVGNEARAAAMLVTDTCCICGCSLMAFTRGGCGHSCCCLLGGAR